MNLFITGGTGFIGAALSQALQQQGHRVTVLSRDAAAAQVRLGEHVSVVDSLRALQQTPVDAVINLAGLPIADRRWTEARKAALRASRVDFTHRLVDAMAQAAIKPGVLVSASAIGYYGDQANRLVDEYTEPREEFTHALCREWEQAALRAESLGIRVCILRLGLVIGPDGGFVKRMLPPFKMGLGGKLGTGQQWMSWVHRNDVQRMVAYLLAHETLQGVFNGVAPRPVRNEEFTQTLAGLLHRPAKAPVPAAILQLSMGEMSQLLLTGQRVVPSRLLEAGFEFQHERVETALQDILR